MIKRTIEISREAVHLAVRLDQLLIQPHGRNPDEAVSVPCEDVGVLVVDHPQTSFSHQALVALIEHDAAVVLCGRDHLPAGLLLPLTSHTEVRWRIEDQIAIGKTLRKQLWQQLVTAKILAQAANLPQDIPEYTRLIGMARRVRSGDPDNLEAQAAKVYWSCWLGPPFKRDPDGDGLNAMLNYAYAILRAAVARALVAAGLLPMLGLHHCHRANAFALADDLLEPLRPMADARVNDLHQWGLGSLDQRAKAHILNLLTRTVRIEDTTGPLMVSLHRMAASLVQCYRGERAQLAIPEAADET